MKVLVCDDEGKRYEATKGKIGRRAKVSPLVGDELAHELESLFQGVEELLDGGNPRSLAAGEFSGFDLVVVDNNLGELSLKGARLTAETIIGYVRAFTDSPYIVSLNKNPGVDFDLRYLVGDYQSLADIALNTKHLSNPCLWERGVEGGFAPWYWPRFENAANRRKAQIDFLSGNLDRPVWSVLGFPAEADDYLSFRAKAPLSSGSQAMFDVTFKAFFESSHALPPKEIERLVELAKEGNELARKAILRVTAHEVDRWLRRDVLGAQDVLIDVPHLVAQMPFLLGSRQGELQGWNDAVAAVSSPFGLDAALFEAHVERARFRELAWAPVPCFWWPVLKRDDGLREQFFEATGEWPDGVFCEDVSRFVQMSGEGGRGIPLEFEAEIDGSWPRRFVSNVDGHHYSPRSRIVGSAA